MKVILTQDVAKLGRRHDVVDAPTGYAMNKLIPQGMAKPATAGKQKEIAAQKEAQAQQQAEAAQQFAEALEKVQDTTVTVSAPANEQGNLFQAVKESEVAAALTERGATVAATHVHIPTPIKTVGEHTIELRSGDLSGAVTIAVEAK